MKSLERLALLAVILGAIMLQAAAQTPPDTGRLIQDQERLRRPEPLRRAPLPEIEEPARPALLAPEGLRIHVTAFRFSRNTLFSDAELAPLLADLAGRELDLADLNAAADRITAYYRQKGFFVASAYLPAQDIQDGVVEITVLEGRLGKLLLENHSLVADRALRPLLSDLQEGRPLSGDVLERSLLLINSLPGVEVQSTLKPGASLGTADLDIRASGQARTSGNLSLDDYGNRFVGAWRLGGQLNVNSPLALGDAFSVRAYVSNGQFDYGRLAYQVPLGSRGLQVGGAWSAMTYRLGQDFAALQAHGTAQIASVYAIHPLQRTRISNVNLQANLDHKRLDDRTDSTDTRSDKTANVLSLGISGDQVDALAGGGFTTWSLGYAAGQLRLDPTMLDLDAAGHKTDGRYGKWSFLAGRRQRLDGFGEAWSLSGQLSGQIAGKNLDSSEKFSLGGAQGVRAYPQGEAPCDDAWLASLELRYALSPAWQLSGFYDTAAGSLNHGSVAADTANRRSLSGAGVGASFNRSGDLSLIATLAWRIGNPSLSDRDRTPRMWLALQKNL